jgi:hypothetical protein
MQKPSCCKEAELYIEQFDESGVWEFDCDGRGVEIEFCPFCGADLHAPHDLPSLLKSIEDYQGPALRICFDVDGLLAVEEGEYDQRTVFEDTVTILKKLDSNGHRILIQTARYMKRLNGDSEEVYAYCYEELIQWLKKHGIPYREVYSGKCSADIYLDDKGCRVSGTTGITGWTRNFLPILKAYANS